MAVKIIVSCGNCRRCKPSQTQMGMYSCKYRDKPFYHKSNTPCENWLPSKIDLRKWLEKDRYICGVKSSINSEVTNNS